MDQVMRKHQGSIVRLKSLKPKPDNNFNHQRKKTFLFKDEPFDQRFHTPYFGRKATSVTKFYQGKPPPHSYSPELINAPVPCFNRKASSVTDFFENFGRPQKKGTLPGGWFGRTATDVSEQHRIIPCPHYGRNTDGPTPYFGRLATFVTDPMRYPGDPSWRSILHHWAEDKRNPKYPGSADEYAVNPNHVSPRDLAAAAAKKRSQMVVGKAWMSSLDRDRILKARGGGNGPATGAPPTPPYAVQTKTAAAHAAAKSARSDARPDEKIADRENGSQKSHGNGSHKACAESSDSHRSHGNGSHKASENGGGNPLACHEIGSQKADSVAKTGGSHRSEPKLAGPGSCQSEGKSKDGRDCPPSLPPSGASCASDGAGRGDAAGCRSPRSELLSPRSDKSNRSGASRPASPKSVLSSKSYVSSGSGTSSHSGTPPSGHTSSKQTSSKPSGQNKHQGELRGSNNSSSSSNTETGDSKSKNSKCSKCNKSSKSKDSGRQMPSDPGLMTCDQLHDYNPDMCATFSAWGGRFKDKERNQPWPVPYEHPNERHTHRKTSITRAPIVN